MNDTIRFMYKLVLIEKTKLKRFVLQYYDIESVLKNQDKGIEIILPDAVTFVEAYGNGK